MTGVEEHAELLEYEHDEDHREAVVAEVWLKHRAEGQRATVETLPTRRVEPPQVRHEDRGPPTGSVEGPVALERT